MNPRETRGFLNANPGNMDRAQGEPWQGEIRDPADPRLTDFQRKELTAGRFAVFASAEWGIRALVRNLMAYQRSGWFTINTMIDHWAPPNENNTAAYKARVSASTGKGLDEPIDMAVYAVAYAMADAIINVECGGMPYGPDVLEDGLRLAGVVKPVGVTTSRTAMAGTVATGATVGTTALGALQDPLQQAADQLSPFAGTSHWIDRIILGLKIGLAVIAVIGIGVMVYERVKRERRDQKIDPNPTMVGQ